MPGIASSALHAFPNLPTNSRPEVRLDAADVSSFDLIGSKVSVWRDKSGNGRHVSQATDANRPSLISGSNADKPTVKFTRASSTRLFNLNWWPTTDVADWTVFIVARWTTLTTALSTYMQVLLDTNHNTGNGFVVQDYPQTAGRPISWSNSTSRWTVGTNSWRLIAASSAIAGANHLFIDTIPHNSGSVYTPTSRPVLCVGAWYNSGSFARHFDGFVAEVLIYN